MSHGTQGFEPQERVYHMRSEAAEDHRERITAQRERRQGRRAARRRASRERAANMAAAAE